MWGKAKAPEPKAYLPPTVDSAAPLFEKYGLPVPKWGDRVDNHLLKLLEAIDSRIDKLEAHLGGGK